MAGGQSTDPRERTAPDRRPAVVGRDRPRVALVSVDLVPSDDTDAVTSHLREVVLAFRNLGAEVEIFTTAPATWNLPAQLADVAIHPISARTTKDAAARERSAMAANVALGLQLRARGPFDLLFERFSAWSHAGIDYAVETGIPGVLEIGASQLACKLPSQNHRTLAEAIGMQVFGGVTSVVASAPEVERCVEMRWGCSPSITFEERTPPPAPVRRFVDSGGFTVGFAGDLEPGLGLLDLVDAFHLLHQRRRDARLLVVGHGSEQPLLEAEFDRRGIERALHVTGWVSPDRRPGLLALMDVAAAPFPTGGSVALAPFKVYEAMVSGLPVVGSRVPPLSHALEHGGTGLTFEPRDVAGLAAALEALADDPDRRREMGRRARERVLRTTPGTLAREVLGMVGRPSDVKSPASHRAEIS